jgi:hypothetical protein
MDLLPSLPLAEKKETRNENGKKQTGPVLGPIHSRKVRNATKYISKSDSILEFCYDDPSTGEMAGFFNRLLEDRKKHVVLNENPENFIAIKEEAKAEYELVSSIDKALNKEFNCIVVSKDTKKNISALLEYLKTVEKAPKFVVWESSNAEENQGLIKDLHILCSGLGMMPSMLGYENAYHREGETRYDLKEGQPQIIPNPPPPRLLHMFLGASAIAFFLFLVWYTTGYFFKRMTPTTKSLANKPTWGK